MQYLVLNDYLGVKNAFVRDRVTKYPDGVRFELRLNNGKSRESKKTAICQ